LYLDTETRSHADLKTVGVYRYSEDLSFAVLMCGWSTGGPARVAVGHEEILAIPGLLDPAVTKVAHNAGFDRVCLAALDDRLRDSEQWLDTAALAAEYGYPVGLDAVARAVGAPPKDSAGSRLIRLFTRPNRDGSWSDADSHPVEWLDFLSYCAQDVDTAVEVHRRLGDWPTPMERQVWVADQRINDRGMRIDIDLCRVAARAVEENRVANKQTFRDLTDVDNPGSVQQVLRWANETAGLNLSDLRAETIQAKIDDPATAPEHVQVLELRQDLALAAGGKFAAALAVVSPDDRIRGGFRFFGAHTGRWTGQRVQPQNLPRAVVDEPEAAILDLKIGLGAQPYTLKALVRSMFVGPLTVVDYASIEARVVAWMAGEQWALDAFRDGRDIYVETAERMGGLTRFQGKVAVLALGYNGGINSLRHMGAEGDDDVLQGMVNVWRRANPRIVRLWETMGEAFAEGGQVGPHIWISCRGNKREMRLPSGRSIWYHDVKLGNREYWIFKPEFGSNVRIHPQNGRPIGPENPPPHRVGWSYQDPKSKLRISTYGGRLVENATQAIARDILAEALVRLDAAGYPVVGHVHDEAIVESDALEDITRLMVQSPPWANGLPLDAEGFVTDRYRKG